MLLYCLLSVISVLQNMLEESKEYQPHTHTCEPHSFFLQLLKCLIIFSASGSSPSPGAGLTGLSARSLPLSLYHLSSHVLICSDSPMVSDPLRCEVGGSLAPLDPDCSLSLCLCVWGWKHLAGGTLCVLVSEFPATAPGGSVLGTWWLEVWWSEAKSVVQDGAWRGWSSLMGVGLLQDTRH